MANGQRMDVTRGADSGRSAIHNQDAELQNGPAPETIDRIRFGNNRGLTGPRGINSFPPFQDTIFVGHVPTFVPARNITPQPGNTIDDTTHIPAIMAGNPLP